LGRHSTLTDQREKELDEMGFIWDSHRASWHERLASLKEFHVQYKHTNVPSNYEDDKPLAVWVKCQRRQMKLFRRGVKSTMTQERIDALEALGFDWNPRNL
jgi:Helicase associated domain